MKLGTGYPFTYFYKVKVFLHKKEIGERVSCPQLIYGRISEEELNVRNMRHF